MSIGYNTSIVRDGLMFQFDLDNQKSWKGKATTNLLNNPRMLPSDPYSSYTWTGSSPYVVNNIGGSGWDFVRYPNSNLSADGGVEWLPQEQGPLSNMGVWKMKVRPGGNSETQINRSIGSVDNTQPITISVYMKCNISGMGRIHLNVTQNGASSWGLASSYHSGNGQWERLSLTIPANSGVSSVNVVRAQCIGATRTDDVLISNFQAEYGAFATQFVEGQRLDTASIIDIAKKNTITANNLTYQADSGPAFDGTDDYISLGPSSIYNITNQVSAFAVINMDDSGGWHGIWGNYSGGGFIHFQAYNGYINVFVYGPNAGYSLQETTQMLGGNHHVGFTYGGGELRVYINGVQLPTVITSAAPNNNISSTATTSVGRVYDANRYMNGQIHCLQVYNRALTADEVMKNFAASKKRYGL